MSGETSEIRRDDGTAEWRRNGKLHRDGDEPAVVYGNGTKVWYKDGKKHRDGDRPAIEYANGDMFWYVRGTNHRDGGQPAIVMADGDMSWMINGKYHRDGGRPAFVGDKGAEQEWWVRDKFVGECALDLETGDVVTGAVPPGCVLDGQTHTKPARA